MGDYMILNDEQKKVVYTNEPFLFLLAGAGSGKTRVIVERIKYLISLNIMPEEILAITFTKKASIEMKERINNINVNIQTFHSFAYNILKKDFLLNFEMIDESKFDFYKEDLLEITKYKNSLYKKEKPKIYESYQKKLKENNLKDFDDLLLDLLKKLQNKYHQYRFKYIFIDEFQDTNLLEYTLLKELISKDTNVIAVGDPNQSIYQFRGASNLIINQFMKDYHAKLYTLNTNYRSSPLVIKHANRLIKQNNQRYVNYLNTTNGTYGEVKNIHFYTEKEESFFIINLIKKFQKLKINLNDISILYRMNYRAFDLKNTLHLEGISHQIHDDIEDHRSDGIHLMTIHKSKGLEFYVVIIIGLEEGILPSHKINTLNELEEERRLLYVAMTRAKQFLYLSSVKKYEDTKLLKPSKFINESGLKRVKRKAINDIISLGEFYGHQKKNT
jgi:DNA helicase II / ATP-dependent DNA helicase PcrA